MWLDRKSGFMGRRLTHCVRPVLLNICVSWERIVFVQVYILLCGCTVVVVVSAFERPARYP